MIGSNLEKILSGLTGSAETPLVGEAVGVPVAALSNVPGLEVDHGLNLFNLALLLGADVQVGRGEERVRAGAGDVADKAGHI